MQSSFVLKRARAAASIDPSENRSPPRKGLKQYSAKRDFPQYCSMETGSCSVSKNNIVPANRNFPEGDKLLSGNFGPVINWSNEGSSTSRDRVKEVLKLFRETLAKLETEAKLEGKRSNISLHTEAAMVLGKPNWVNTDKRLGPVPGVQVGDMFQYRTELYVIGLHLQFQRGIDYMKMEGILLATSIVVTDLYSNRMISSDVLIYSGEGGNPKFQNPQLVRDQVLGHGNLALKKSMEMKSPVRVIMAESFKNKASSRHNALGGGYVYDGLYLVEKYWQERGKFGKLIFNFQLRRMTGQLESTRGLIGESKKSRSLKVVRIVNDISDGKEEIPIAVVNTVDDERPSEFIYVANTTGLVENIHSLSIGCDCADQCSSSEDCSCKAKNGQQIPYDDCKRLVRKTPCIYECSHSCKCSDSCINRVSQLGIKLQLEVFKTESKGWGVRTRSYIRAGSFICEYVGTIIQAKEAEKMVGRDEYRFDIGDNYDDRIVRANNVPRLHCSDQHFSFYKKDWGFAIDAGKCGNIARFINHSCSPNLQVQNVVYEHHDSGVPHVMLFAKKNIPPSTELTYDYNCRLGEPRYMNGNVKAKKCMCKSPNCGGKFY